MAMTVEYIYTEELQSDLPRTASQCECPLARNLYLPDRHDIRSENGSGLRHEVE